MDELDMWRAKALNMSGKYAKEYALSDQLAKFVAYCVENSCTPALKPKCLIDWEKTRNEQLRERKSKI